MLALRHGKRAARGWLLLLLLALFLGALLSSCINQGEGCAPPENIYATATVLYASGRVYLFSPGATEYGRPSLYALRASDGKELWHAQGILQASDADHLYLLLDPNHLPVLEALRASDGKVLWQSRQPVGFRTLGALDGSVYLNEDSDDALLALNAADGKERWNSEHTQLSPGPDADTGNVSLQVVNGIVYARSSNGVLSAFREEDGAPLWSHDFLGTFDAQSPWLIAQGMIYLSTRDNLFALRASDGQESWAGDAASIALDPSGSILYALSNPSPSAPPTQSLSALRAQDGHVLWTRTEPGLLANHLQFIDGTLYAGPLQLDADALSVNAIPNAYVTDYKGSVYALRASDGQELWDYQGIDRGRVNLLAVSVANGIAYLLAYQPTGQANALLMAKQASDGRQLWQRAVKQAGGMLFADGALYTGYGGDNLTSYRGCPLNGPVVGTQLRPADGSQFWRFQSEE